MHSLRADPALPLIPAQPDKMDHKIEPAPAPEPWALLASAIVDEAQQLAELRTALRAGLASRGVNDDSTDDLTLVLSELVGNGLQHGQVPLHLVATMRTGPAQGRHIVRIQVTDGGRRTMPVEVVDALGEGGRGLGIVAALSDDWGLEYLPGRGTVAWAERVVHSSR